MARFRKVETRTWSDEKFSRLSPMPPSGQGLWLHLLTSPSSIVIPGLIVAGKASLAELLGWETEDVSRCFAEIEAQGMARADFQRRLIWLPKALEYNPPESPNVVLAWAKAWPEVPECQLKLEIEQVIGRFVLTLTEGFQEAFRKGFKKALPEAQPGDLFEAMGKDTPEAQSKRSAKGSTKRGEQAGTSSVGEGAAGASQDAVNSPENRTGVGSKDYPEVLPQDLLHAFPESGAVNRSSKQEQEQEQKQEQGGDTSSSGGAYAPPSPEDPAQPSQHPLAFPYGTPKDPKWFVASEALQHDLKIAYPLVDLKREAAKMRLWCQGNQTKWKKLPERFLRNWCDNAQQAALKGSHATSEIVGSDAFRSFVSAYPSTRRNERVSEAFACWTALDLDANEGLRGDVLAGLESWKQTESWKDAGGKFVPGMQRFLSEKRWTNAPSALESEGAGPASWSEQLGNDGFAVL